MEDPKDDIHRVLNEFNSLTSKLRFTLEEEQGKLILFLDITITKNPKVLSFGIYRKPTTNDIIIPRDSCHPNEHKTAAITYYRNRLETYQLTPKNKGKKEIIEQIRANNKYDAHLLKIEQNKKNKTAATTTETKMSKVHICRQRNQIRHKGFQTQA